MCPAIVWYRTTCQSVGVLVIIQEQQQQQKKKRDGTLGVCVCVCKQPRVPSRRKNRKKKRDDYRHTKGNRSDTRSHRQQLSRRSRLFLVFFLTRSWTRQRSRSERDGTGGWCVSQIDHKKRRIRKETFAPIFLLLLFFFLSFFPRRRRRKRCVVLAPPSTTWKRARPFLIRRLTLGWVPRSHYRLH